MSEDNNEKKKTSLERANDSKQIINNSDKDILISKFQEAVDKYEDCIYKYRENQFFKEDKLQTRYWEGRRDAILEIINMSNSTTCSLEKAIQKFCSVELLKKIRWNKVLKEISSVQEARERGEELYYA